MRSLRAVEPDSTARPDSRPSDHVLALLERTRDEALRQGAVETDPQLRAMADTTGEVLSGLITAYEHFRAAPRHQDRTA